jgi:hypothetical protein
VSAAIVLAIVVATQNVDDQATEAMRATAAEAIGGEDSVVVREVEVPSDAESLRIERTVHARNVALVVWLDTVHTRARVRVHVADTGRWTERSIAFSPVDTPVERGRALGFAVTSMLPEEALSARPHRAVPRPPPPVPPETTPPTEDLPTALRLGVIGSTGLDGPAGGIGGSLAGEFFISRELSLRVGFGMRRGDISSFGSDLVIYGGLGAAFWPLPPGRDRRLAVGVRVDGLALDHLLSDTRSAALGSRSQSKWLPGIDILGEAGWRLAGALEIVASLGLEVAFGSTPLQLRYQPDVGDPFLVDFRKLPLFRGVVETGIRLSF